MRASIDEKRTVRLYMAFVFLTNFGTMISFLPVYLAYSGLTLANISLFFFVRQACKFFFEIPAGLISDACGRKRTGQFGLVGMIGYFALLYVSYSEWSLLVAFIVRGFSEAALSGTFESLFVESAERGRLVRYNAMERFLFYVSNGASAVLGGLLAAAGFYKMGIAIDGISFFIALMIATGINEGRADSVKDIGYNSKQIKKIKLYLAQNRQNKTLLYFFAMDLAQAFAFVGLEDFYALVLQDAGFDASLIGVLIALQLVLTSSGGFLVPWVSGHYQKRGTLVCCALARILVTGALLMSWTPVILLPVLYLIGDFLYALFAPIKYEAFQLATSDCLRSTCISIQSQMVALGALAFYGVSSFLSQAIGIQSMLLVALMLSSLMYIPAVLRIASSLSE